MKAAFIIVTVTALWLGACIATAVPTPAMSVSCATAAATPPAVREYWIKFLAAEGDGQATPASRGALPEESERQLDLLTTVAPRQS
jgi:hypothetical protein